MPKKIETLEEVREYVKTCNNILSSAWEDMLYDMENFGETYTIVDFTEEAEWQIALGHISAGDLF